MNIFLKKSTILFIRVLIGLVTKKLYFQLGNVFFSHFLPIFVKFQAESESVSKVSLLDNLTLNFLLLLNFLVFSPSLTLKALV